MLIYGTGGHAKVLVDCCNALGISITGMIDDGPKVKDPFYGHSVVKVYNPKEHVSPLVIAIGNNATRKIIADKVKPLFGVVVHPSVILQKDVQVGEGSVIYQGAVIQIDTIIGRHVIVNTAANIDHDCVIEDFAHIAPNATLCGGITIGEGTLVGAGSTILPNIKIGKWVTIGAGSVITKNIPDRATVVGNPGKLVIK